MLWVKLDTEEGQALMYDAFVGVIIGIGEERKPACWQ